ncbi:hypothetical protein CO668_30855 [Rhizobium anhuiense]|uniref:hypothetical protein n=1 Tax=Rhizobium anhuiense TaxID=1184720 RepID=UPI000BE8CDC6|nr:hypothetical protein [Rhizobium anhuiense]PDS41145.1 hypothetical protein CO668_30855 [Rhizobium anhuiense]
MNSVIWTSKDIIAAVIATGLVSAAFRELIELAKVSWRKQSEVQYLCVSASIALEAFALECRELTEMMQATYHQRGVVGSISVPSPPKLPPDCNWRLIDITLMNELLSFENMVRKAQIDADLAAHFEGNTWSHTSEVLALMEKAKAVASQLRTNVGLS